MMFELMALEMKESINSSDLIDTKDFNELDRKPKRKQINIGTHFSNSSRKRENSLELL